MWRKAPGFTLVAVAALALGIGANTAIFSVVNAVLLSTLPYADAGRLVMVWEDASTFGFPRNTPAPGNFADWRTEIEAFEGVGAVDTRDFNLTGTGNPEKVGGAGATANLFAVLGVKPLLGRAFLPEEDTGGPHRVAVIGYGLWTRRFSADPSLVGQTIALDGAAYTVVGVMPPRFQFPFKEVEIWVPSSYSAEELADRGSHYLMVAARLRRGATLDQANAQLRVLADRRKKDYPDTNRALGMYAVRLLDDYVGDLGLALRVLVAAVACVLLIACANLANLLLVRATARRREIAVRTALGAGRGQIVRQLVTENVMLSLAGGGMGLLLAYWSFAVIKNLIPEQMTDITSLSLDGRVLAFTLVVSGVTGILVSLVPAWQLSRKDLTSALKDGGTRGTIGGRGGLVRGAFVVAEIALALTLLICASLMIKSFSGLAGLQPGFFSERVLTVRTTLPRPAYANASKRAAFVDGVLARVRVLPGVESAGYTSALPLVWKGGTSGFWPESPKRPQGEGFVYDANNRVVSPGYFETMRMTLRSGRFFDERDGVDALPVAIINDSMAKTYWPSENAIGQRFKFDGPDAKGPWLTIVGIVGDTRMMGLDQPSRPEMYFPVSQADGNWMWPRDLVVRASADPMSLTADIRRAVWSVDKDQPVSNVMSLDAIVDIELLQRRTQVMLLGAFATLALVLACLGIYGVLAYVVTERTSEIGLRRALGAQTNDVVRHVVGRGMALAATGIAMGLILSFWATRLLEGLLYQVRARDPLTFAALTALLLTVCLVAVYLPARRAGRIDPMVALRGE